VKYLIVLLLALFAFNSHAQPTTSSTSTSGSGSQATVGVNAAPQQNIEFNSQSSSGGTLRNVPSIFPPSFAPSTPCSSVVSGGAGFAGFGISLGGSYVDEECNVRETARLLHLIGQPDAAIAIMCTNAIVARTSPQLCKRVDYVASRPVDYVSAERPIMPPAPVSIPKEAPPPPPQPAVGTMGYGTDGRSYRYDGSAWRQVQAATAVTLTDEASATKSTNK
jgi:hypothetical protein